MSSREILQGPINPQVCVTVSALKESRGLWRRGATGCNNMPLSHPYPYLPGLPDGLISPYHANAQRPRRRCCCVDRAAFRGDASGIVSTNANRSAVAFADAWTTLDSDATAEKAWSTSPGDASSE